MDVLPLVLGCCLLAPTLAPAQEQTDWPRFLGPNRDGHSPDTVVVDGWRSRDLRERWRVKVGRGYSGITTGGGLVFSMDRLEADEFVFARRADDGTEVWRVRTGHSPGNVYGGLGPRVTPTVDGDLVLTVSAEGVLFALDRNAGSIRWRRDLKSDLAWRPPAEGTSSTPLVEDGRVYLIVGGGTGRAVGSFDRNTGETLWTAGDDRTSYSSATVLELGGTRQVLFLLGNELAAFAPETGRKLWNYSWEPYDRVNVATPILVGPDRVFISSGYDQGAAVLDLSGSEPHEVWRSRVMKNHFNNSVHHRGVLYGFDESIFKAIASATGELLWRARGFGKGSVMVAGDHLIVLSDDGTLALVAPSRQGLEVIREQSVLAGRTWTPPSIANGRIYLRNHEEMVCFEPAPLSSKAY